MSEQRIATRRILIVEDEKDLVRLIQRRLESDGYEVLSTGNAESGLRIASEAVPALIIMDIGLPAMDGLSFLRLLRKKSGIPVILLSGRSSDVDRILGLKAGADDYVTKPFSLNELVVRIELLLRRHVKGEVKKRRPSAS